MIELSDLHEMFGDLRAIMQWNMDGPMLWGYFFTDRSRQKLEGAAAELEQLGYRYVDIFASEPDEARGEYFFLHVEREEVHSPESLNTRNMQLEIFSEKHGLDSYHGMDVGC